MPEKLTEVEGGAPATPVGSDIMGNKSDFAAFVPRV